LNSDIQLFNDDLDLVNLNEELAFKNLKNNYLINEKEIKGK
jgi:hypothetical protein